MAIPLTYTVIQSRFPRAAPVAIVAMMMAVSSLYDAISEYGVGTLGGLYDRLSPTDFWLASAAVEAMAWLSPKYRP